MAATDSVPLAEPDTMKEGSSEVQPNTNNSTQMDKWGDVMLTISNSVLPLEKLSPTPSSLDSMSQVVEDDLRNLGCNLIQTAGKLLKLPQVAIGVLQTCTLIGQEAQLSSSCPIRASQQTNNNALIG